jgi:hypothetical protein
MVRRAVLTIASVLAWSLVGVAQRGVQVTATDSQGKPTIHVWSVGSPHTGETTQNIVPPAIKREADKLGYQIEMQTFAAKGFADNFFAAVAEKREPDILVIDNYGIIKDIATKSETIIGLASNPSVPKSLIDVSESLKDFVEGTGGGWEFLVSTSPNHHIARSLAMRKPECSPAYAGTSPVDEASVGAIKEMAVSASYAYLNCSSMDMRKISDSARLETGCLTDPPAQVASSSACGVFGNQNLLFVPTVNAFEVKGKQLGHKTLLAVLRKDGDRLKLLTITDDPISIQQLATSIPRLSGLLRSEAGAESHSLAPASLVTPDGTYPAPEQGSRFGDFNWRPSSSSSVVCEVAEFEYGNATRLFFFFRDSDWTEKVSAGQLWTTNGSWRWRIWSIADTGRLILSEQRSFKH